MSGPPPPPPPPDPQPYRLIAYPNYFLGTLAYGDTITVVPTVGTPVTAPLMDVTAYGVTVWVEPNLVHAHWDKILRLEWEPPTP